MPRDLSLNRVLVIGSGPIVIGQAAEFDYAGAQACKALREEGISVVLVNSNPATIMTDANMADRVYIEPLTVDALTAIIEQERPEGLLPTLGGQTGLNLAMALEEAGVLDRFNVRLLGTSLDAIREAEDREAFRDLMHTLSEPIAGSEIVTTWEEARQFAERAGLPLIVRPAFTLAGTGGGVAHSMQALEEIVQQGLLHSPIHQVLVEESLLGWKEIEYEVMRDSNDTAIVVCNMENFDPVGIHTGDSIVVAPSQTLQDREYQMLRSSALRIIRALAIEGGCNVQYALHPTSLEYRVIEVNPRVSRSSALASKATGYPIAKVAAKIAIGFHLHEIPNAVTGKTPASFEPSIDYIVVKIPKWPFDKFPNADHYLGTQMKSTGEAMALDRNFERALLKAVEGLDLADGGLFQNGNETLRESDLLTRIAKPDHQRLFLLAEAMKRGISVAELQKMTGIDLWFLEKLQQIVAVSIGLQTDQCSEAMLRQALRFGLVPQEADQTVFKMVDSCAGEFEASTPYYYATEGGENENTPTDGKKVLILGSGPIRIGQGIEFDYCSVHAALALREAGYESLMLNNNPETVSTDFDTADKLFFEPVTLNKVQQIVAQEKPLGVMVQFGGQTAVNLVNGLEQQSIPILGTLRESMDIAENRQLFNQALDQLGIPHPQAHTASRWDDALAFAQSLGYPILLRPSYVIGGRNMRVIEHDAAFHDYQQQASPISADFPILIDQYIPGLEVEVDAISDGTDILIPGLVEHVEKAGIHSGDSISVYPAFSLSDTVRKKLIDYTKSLATHLQIVGLLNIQFVVNGDDVLVLELNPRASRTVPILSKVTGVPMVSLAVRAMLGTPLAKQGYGTGLAPEADYVAVKAPIFSAQKLRGVDTALAPEMRSTGEVLGIANTRAQAFHKAFAASGYPFPKMEPIETSRPGLLVSLRSADREAAVPLLQSFIQQGFRIIATPGTGEALQQSGLAVHVLPEKTPAFLRSQLKAQNIQLALNTPTQGHQTQRAGFAFRETMVQHRIPCLTSVDTAGAYLEALISAQRQPLVYQPIQLYPHPIKTGVTFS
jgi:carbamoyl-phosphate synthase large subunit